MCRFHHMPFTAIHCHGGDDFLIKRFILKMVHASLRSQTAKAANRLWDEFCCRLQNTYLAVRKVTNKPCPYNKSKLSHLNPVILRVNSSKCLSAQSQPNAMLWKRSTRQMLICTLYVHNIIVTVHVCE